MFVWDGDRNDRKTVNGGIILQGENPIVWFSKKQQWVVPSSHESEYIAIRVYISGTR